MTAAMVKAQQNMGLTWPAWINFLARNYRRSNRRSPVLDPVARRTLAWSARSLDTIASAVTGQAFESAVTTPEIFQRAADALSILDELNRVRAALEKWAPSPVIPKKGVKHHAQ
jgi:hypothetical protein